MTNELVTIINNKPQTTSLSIADKFDKLHKHVLRDIKNLLSMNESLAPCFELSSYKATNNRTYPMYYIDRDGFSLLVMGFTGKRALDFKITYINAFNRLEQEMKNMLQNSASYMIADPIERAKAWIKEEQERQQLALENKELKPKAEFADAIAASENSIKIGEFAKILNNLGMDTGPIKLFEWLRENNFLIKTGEERNNPQQRYINQGIFEVKQGVFKDKETGKFKRYSTTLITGKGQIYFVEKFLGKLKAQEYYNN